MTGYVIYGLLFVLLVVFSIMTVRNWHWSSIVVLILTYIAGVAASLGAAKCLQLRRQAIAEYDRAEQRLERITRELSKARYGESDAPFYASDSLYGVEEALKLRFMGRGRVWMNGQVEESGANRLFRFSVARDAANPQIGALNSVQLFAFLDEEISGVSYPSRFLGVFRGSDEKADSILLTPELVISNDDLSRAGTWTLFERMPTDRNGVFSRKKADGSGDMNLSEFRSELETRWFPPDVVGLDPSSVTYERLIDRFAFDGLTLGEIQSWIDENAGSRRSQRFDPSPDELFVPFTFNKASSRSYAVDGQGNLETDGPYSFLGQAIDPAIRLGRDVQFKAGDTIYVDLATARGFTMNDGTRIEQFDKLEDVTPLDENNNNGWVFRRRLVDFPTLIADLRQQSAWLTAEKARTARQAEIQAQTLAEAARQEAWRADVNQKFRADNDNLRRDLDQITALLEQRRSELELMRQEIDDLKRKIESDRRRRDASAVSLSR